MNVQAVAKVETRQELAAPQQESLLAVIGRAAQDPNTDVTKMERLMAMYERMEAHRSEAAFNEAMMDAQARIGRIGADKQNTQTHSWYATYAAIDREVRPVYTDCGFSLSFNTEAAPTPELLRVVCYVSHRAGFTRTYSVDMPADGKGAKGGDVMTKTHAAGSAMSYGQRYLLKLIFNIAIGVDPDDDDGNAAAAETVTPDQAAKLREWLESTGSDLVKFCKAFKIDAVEHLAMRDYGPAMAMLETKVKRHG